MEKVLKAQWNPKKESEEKVFEKRTTFETAVRGLDVSNTDPVEAHMSSTYA